MTDMQISETISRLKFEERADREGLYVERFGNADARADALRDLQNEYTRRVLLSVRGE
jgi:hypothetical protein